MLFWMFIFQQPLFHNIFSNKVNFVKVDQSSYQFYRACIVMIRFSAQDAKFLGDAQTGEEALIKDMALFYGAQ